MHRRGLHHVLSGKWVSRIVVWTAIVVVWQLLAASLGPQLLPGLDAILIEGLPEVFALGYQFTLLETLGEMMVGFAVACGIAIPMGAIMGVSRVWNDFLQPYAYGLYVTPREALLPLLIILFGTGMQYKIVIVVLFSAFFPLVNVAKGVSEVVHGPLAEMARSICTSRWRFFTSILFPGSLPYVIAGIRLGLGMAFNGVVVAEIWTSVGAGGALESLASYRQLAAYFALTALVAAAAITSYWLLGAIEQRLRVGYGMDNGKKKK